MFSSHAHDHRRQEGQDDAQREAPRLGRDGQADQRLPEGLEIDRHHRQDRAQLDDDGEGFPVVAQAQQPLRHQQMAGRGYGQEFGQAFDNAQA